MGSWSVGPRQSASAIAGLRQYLPASNRANREWGGSICRNRLGQYSSSDPETELGDCDKVPPSPCASGTLAGEYHTHVCTDTMDGVSGPDAGRMHDSRLPGYIGVDVDFSARPIDCASRGQGNIWKFVMDPSAPFKYPYVLLLYEVIACAPVK